MKYLLQICTVLFLFFSPAAIAEDTLNSGNTAWLLTSTALVLMMTIPGLALFYAGLRDKNVLSVLMQCFTITCVVSVVWLVAGYSLVFDDRGNFMVGGLGKFLLAGVLEESMTGDVSESAFALFQVIFPIIAVTLILVSFTEKIKFGAVIIFSALWTVVVYAPIAHWVWGGGWLQVEILGALDFAGGSVVHIAAGASAMVAACFIADWNEDSSGPMSPHNKTLTMIGAGMLWVGWFGISGGSAVATNQDAAMAILVTHMCAATAALSFVATEYYFRKSVTALAPVIGMVAGLVAITPAAGFVGPAGAMVIGIITGPICYLFVKVIKVFAELDSVIVLRINGIAGIVGMVLTGIFASAHLGIFSGQGMENTIFEQFMFQMLACSWNFAYAGTVTFLILMLTRLLVGLQVSDEAKVQDLDVSTRDERTITTFD